MSFSAAASVCCRTYLERFFRASSSCLYLTVAADRETWRRLNGFATNQFLCRPKSIKFHVCDPIVDYRQNRDRGLKFRWCTRKVTNFDDVCSSLVQSTRHARAGFNFFSCFVAFVTSQSEIRIWSVKVLKFDPKLLQKPINFFSLLHHAMHFERKFLISHHRWWCTK